MSKQDIKLSHIVAMAENRCIGKDNQMPWHISDDLKRFKTLTMGHPVIMGRKTFESILGYLKKPLSGRDSIIISRSGYENEFGVPVYNADERAKFLMENDSNLIYKLKENFPNLNIQINGGIKTLEDLKSFSNLDGELDEATIKDIYDAEATK